MLDFQRLRADGAGQTDAFEEFAAQLFRRLDLPESSATFERYQGSGGDGGVEAVWRLASGKVIGLQAKFFLPVKPGHRSQLFDSFDTALENHPTLYRYIVALPFDPTPTIKARAGKGQQNLLDTWQTDLVTRAANQGRTVAVEWWLATELKDRLLALPNAEGRILYWFGTGAVGKAAIRRRIETARGIAGPRYSPVLKVDTPAGGFISAAGATLPWFESLTPLKNKLVSAKGSWDAPTATGDAAEAAESLAMVVELARGWSRRIFDSTAQARLIQIATDALPTAQRLVLAAEAAFHTEHGADKDTPHFRQFEAEYNARFPASDLDRARDLVKLWTELLAFAASPQARAAAGELAVLFGPAGIGKTHAMIDACEQRLEDGLFSVPILGEELHVGRDLWSFLATALDLPATTTRAELVGALASAAERTGRPLLLMFDAANETPSRDRWRNWIHELVAATRETPVRVLISCRDVFAEETLGAGWEDLAAFRHPGFVGFEQDAALAFARHYGLTPPAEVIAQPEFANPLFLHLLCRASKAAAETAIPAGAISLVRLVERLLKHANDQAASDLDVDPRTSSPVIEGVRALAGRMAQVGGTSLPLSEAESVLTDVHPSGGRASSLLRALETQSLLSVVPGPSGHVARFAFERLGDMLIADACVRSLDARGVSAALAPGGSLSHLVSDRAAVAANAGLIQALSIVVPESFNFELAKQVSDADAKMAVAELALDVLAWRDPEKIGHPTNLTSGFRTGNQIIALFARTLAVATVPDHPLGAEWLDEQLVTLPIVDRDAIWSTTLVRMWEGEGHAYRLVRLAREADLGSLAIASARDLGITLCWFLACADRRVRDQATKGLVRLILAKPALGPQLVRRFSFSDDDYIFDRVLTAAYGAGLLARDAAVWLALADAVETHVFARHGGPPTNALIRDTARLIVQKGREAGMSRPSPDPSVPPFASAWPLYVASSSWAALKKAHKEYPPNMFIEPNVASDFGRYVAAGRVFGHYDLGAVGLSDEAGTRWIFEQTLQMGYPGRNGWGLAYDWTLHNEQGSGRAAPGHAERLGKKYAWIQLARIAGHLADYAPPRRDSWAPPPPPEPLQGVSLRAIDPTIGVLTAPPAPRVAIRRFFQPPSPPRDALDDVAWTRAAAVHGFHADHDGWTALHLTYTARQRDEDGNISWDSLRSEDVLISAFAAKVAQLRVWTPAAVGQTPDVVSAPSRLFLGELGFGYAETRLADEDVDQDLLGLAVRPVFRRAHGEFEGDYSGDELTLWAPSEDLLAHMGATWDGGLAWRDAGGEALAVTVMDGDWQGLLVRTESLKAALAPQRLGLVWSMFVGRTAKRGKFRGYFDQRRVFRRRRGKLVEAWSAAETSGLPKTKPKS